MKLVKKFISIYLSSLILLPSVCAMKSSISMPENLCQYAHSEEEDIKSSPYELYRYCERVIAESPHTPIDKTINDTTYACAKAFKKILYALYDDAPSDRFYIAILSNYMPVIEQINHLLFQVILSKSDSTKLFFTPSPETISNVDSCSWAVSTALKRYERIFCIELRTTFPKETTTKQLYDLMCDTWEGVWRISQLNSFR